MNLTRPECILFLKYEIMFYIWIFYVSEVFCIDKEQRKAVLCNAGVELFPYAESKPPSILSISFESLKLIWGVGTVESYSGHTSQPAEGIGAVIFISQKDQMNCRLDTSLLFF